ncbi:hypothetical protein BD779DRAFT_1684793 [Infundibulicybe gibba]|nr:hypothetical protein BD779DRAFT_1684793 [Infundibulicybe gibba]
MGTGATGQPQVPVWPYLNYKSNEMTASRMTILACKADLMLFQHIQYLSNGTGVGNP